MRYLGPDMRDMISYDIWVPNNSPKIYLNLTT